MKRSAHLPSMPRPATALVGLALFLLLAGCAPPFLPTAGPTLSPIATAPPTAVPPTLPAGPTVEVPTSPAGPTPEPLLPIVYERAGDLWLYDGGASRPLTRDGRSFQARLSPDGRRVLFHRHEEPTAVSSDPQSLWLLDLQSGQEVPVDLSVLPTERAFTEAGEEVDVPRWPALEEWLPDSSGVLLNTAVDYSMVGPGWGPGDDLWLLDAATGRLRSLFPGTQPPARFTLSPDGRRLLLSRPEGIEVLTLATGERRTLLEHPRVLTYSEYAWLAEPRWLPDGRAAHVAIAPADPLESQTYTLWRLDVEAGTAQQLGQVQGSIFAWSPDGASWSPDGARLVYISTAGDMRQVILANADGSGGLQVAMAAFPVLMGWSPGGRYLLYQDGESVFTLQVDPTPRVHPLPVVSGAFSHYFWRGETLWIVEESRLLQVAADGSGVQEVGP